MLSTLADIQFVTVPSEFGLWSLLKNTSQSSLEIMNNVALSPLLMVPSYFIARDKSKRNIRPLDRYGKLI